MQSLPTHEIGAEGNFPAELNGVNGGGALNVTEQYVGPSAWWIASRLFYPVRFEEGWYWTKATCHATGRDQMAFRQRPDGNGIEVRCTGGGCSPESALDALGWEIGWPIRFAYEPMAEPVGGPWRPRNWPWWRIAWYAAAALALTAPLLMGHGPQAALVNLIGFSAGSLLMDRILQPGRVGRFRR